MKNALIYLCLCFGLLINLDGLIAQPEVYNRNGSVVQMSPAEYQALIGTLVKARKKKLARRRAYYPPPRAQANAALPGPQPDASTLAKLKELERSYERISEQQKLTSQYARDTVLNSQLVTIKESMEAEMKSLQSQLQAEREATKRIKEERRMTDLIDQKRAEGREEYNSRYREEQRHADRQLENRINSLNREQDRQSRENIQLHAELSNLKRKLERFEEAEKAKDTRLSADRAAEVAALHRQIKTLENSNERLALLLSQQAAGSDTAIIVNTAADLSQLSVYDRKLAELEVKLQALQSQPPTEPAKVIDHGGQLKSVEAKIAALEASLKAHSHASSQPLIINAPAPPTEPTPQPPKEDIRTFVTRYQQQNVYFRNGASSLTSQELQKLRQIADWLSTYERLEITIKGYASNVGSLAVNQRLSKERAETVKRELLGMGVQADRIILQPLGIDTVSTDPAHARRAEVHLLIRE